MQTFIDYAEYYNAFYRDKDYQKEAETVSDLLKKYGNNPRSIINFGCGTGRHDVELAKLGYRCVGIDLSEQMIEIARENAEKKGLDIEFSVSDIRDYKSERKYEAVISLFHVISYQSTNEDVLAAFRTARNMLEKGGVLLFDSWFGPGVLSEKPEVRVKKVETDTSYLIRMANPKMYPLDNLVDVSYEILSIDKKSGVCGKIDETHRMRYFFSPEIQLMLEMAGFKLCACLDCGDLGAADYSSWTVYFIAEAV